MDVIMYRLQMKFQSIITYLCLAAAALTFFYSLGVSTDAYFLRTLESLSVSIPGSEMYYEMQPFNKDFTTYSIVAILLAVACLGANNHKRRKYYVANYCTTVISSVADIALAIWAFINVFEYKAKFLAVDYSNLEAIGKRRPNVLINLGVDPNNVYGPYSTFWFDIAAVVLSILIIAALLNVANMIFKIIVMKEEQKLLKEGGAK